LAAVFRTRTRDEWAEVFAATDACVAPVLTLTEAPRHPHSVERSTFVERAGVVQPAPAPRFSRTPTALDRTPPAPGDHTDEILAELGYDRAGIERLRTAGAVT
jgi:alpha-methylacyl-CoA racemase